MGARRAKATSRNILETSPSYKIAPPERLGTMSDQHQTCSCHEPHVHGYNADSKSKDRYLARLKRIEGQARGIHRMVEEDQYCIDIITQISAVKSALENVSLALLEDHIEHCVAGAAAEDGEVATEKLEEAMRAIKKMMKN